MKLEHALEGIEQEEVRNRLKARIDDIFDEDDEKSFWEFRTKLLAKFNIPDPLLSAGSISHAEMPLFLAHAWKQYAGEAHPRVRLHLMLEFVELSIRFSVAVLISQIRACNEDQLPEDLASKLSQLIRNPTLGQWLGILRALSSHQPESAPLPELFSLYSKLDADVWLSNKDEFTEEQSVLVLRNHVAHGGGFSNQKASDWADDHKGRVEAMLTKILEALGSAQFISADRKLLLMGEKSLSFELKGFPEGTSGCWVQAGDITMPLWPLADYAPVSCFDKNGQLQELNDEPSAQIYASLNKMNLNFTPLGSDACISQHHDIEVFRELFALQENKHQKSEASAYRWNDFINDGRDEAEQLVGRKEQIEILKNWIKGRDSRKEGVSAACWVHGKAGMGKSMLVAKVVTDLADGANGEKVNGLYYHRFRAGDGRNNLRMFMKLFQRALWEWKLLQEKTEKPDFQLEGDKLLEDLQQRLSFVEEMQAKHEKATSPRYLLVVDGLDEVVSHEPLLVEYLQRLLLPGIILVASSRDEQGLGEAMHKLAAEDVFPDGLEELNAHEVRAMLEKELRSASLLKALAAFDLENAPKDVIPENKYVQNVLKQSEGLPLYVHLLVDDLKKGIRKLDDDKLPDSLRAYYDEIMNRIGLSDVRRDLTEIIATLAVSREPMERDALAQFLADGDKGWECYSERVGAALEAGSSLLRITKSEDNSDGYTTYHQSYREYLLSIDSPIRGSISDAGKKLIKLAEAWPTLVDGNLKNHLFRQATAYAFEAGSDASRLAAKRLCNFGYLMERLKSLPASEVASLCEEYRQLEKPVSQPIQIENHFRDWERFMQGNAHCLSCGDECWPANRILLQLGVEHADDSPITLQAEEWLTVDGNCNWLWMRSANRRAQYVLDPCLQVFESQLHLVRGLQTLDESRFLLWTEDGSICLWDIESDSPPIIYEGSLNNAKGFHLLDDGRALLWTEDGSICLWDIESDSPPIVYEGSLNNAKGFHLLDDGRALLWTEDGSICLWDIESDRDRSPVVLESGLSSVKGLQLIDAERAFLWSEDGSVSIFTLSPATFHDLSGPVGWDGVSHLLPDRRAISWSSDMKVYLWDLDTATNLHLLENHMDKLRGAYQLPDNRVLLWSEDRTVWTWNLETGTRAYGLGQYTDRVTIDYFLPDNRALTWMNRQTICVWNLVDGTCSSVLEEFSRENMVESDIHRKIRDVQLLSNDRAIILRDKNELSVWNLRSGSCENVLIGHTGNVKSISQLSDDRALSWDDDGSIRYWDLSETEVPKKIEGHGKKISRVEVIPGDRVISRSMEEPSVCLWDLKTGKCLRVVKQINSEVHTLSGRWGRNVWSFQNSRTKNALEALLNNEVKVAWYGNRPSIHGCLLSNSWVVVDGDVTVKVLYLWQGNKQYYVSSNNLENPKRLNVERERRKKRTDNTFTNQSSEANEQAVQFAADKLSHIKVEAGVISKPSKLSLFQMQTMIRCPARWVLRCHGNIEAAAYLNVPSSDSAAATLCKKVIHELYRDTKSWVATSLKYRTSELFDEFIPQEAPVLLEPKYLAAKERYRNMLCRSVEIFDLQREIANLNVVAVNHTADGQSVNGIPFQAHVDLLLEDDNGNHYVIVFIWAGSNRYLRKLIENGESLQLASLSWLFRNVDGSWAPSAYFMVQQGKILTTDGRFYGSSSMMDPDNKYLNPDWIESPLTAEEVWSRGVKTWLEMFSKVMSGEIEVSGILGKDPAALETLRSQNGLLYISPPCYFCHYEKLCGKDRSEA